MAESLPGASGRLDSALDDRVDDNKHIGDEIDHDGFLQQRP
jgi:hypothetical protein